MPIKTTPKARYPADRHPHPAHKHQNNRHNGDNRNPKRGVPAIVAAAAPAMPTVSTQPGSAYSPSQHIRAHSQDISRPAITTTASNQGDPTWITANTGGAKTSADKIRRRRFPGFRSGGGCAITPFAASKFCNRIFELFARKIRPEYIGENQFRISGLPQQEIADPVFPASSDD